MTRVKTMGTQAAAVNALHPNRGRTTQATADVEAQQKPAKQSNATEE